MGNDKKIILVATECDFTTILFHEVNRVAKIDAIVFESKVSAFHLLRRRISKLGFFTVFGQVLFQIFVVKILSWFSKNRIKEIIQQYHLSLKPINEAPLFYVKSINSKNAIQLLRELNPDLILINGTRIISKEVIESAKAPIVNIHAGITPAYRGVHGAYWALYNLQPEICGVTVHRVDAGIDTGEVLGQKKITTTEKDNFCTYPYLQFAEGTSLLVQLVRDFLDGKEFVEKAPMVQWSKLWYHPTIFQYCKGRILKKVK